VPADPVEFRIVEHLQAALLAISVAGGYHHDVAAFAVKLDPNHDVESLIGATAKRPFAILALDPDTFSYSPSMMVRIAMPATVHFVNDSDPTDDASWIEEYFTLCADVERAVAQDITRGGLAIDTRIVQREYRSFQGQQVWAQVKLDIGVRRTYGSPNG